MLYAIDVRHCDGEWSMREDSAYTICDALYKAELMAKDLDVSESVHVAGYSIRGKRDIVSEAKQFVAEPQQIVSDRCECGGVGCSMET